MAETRRFPDLVIIGAMKSATSSLYWWLDRQPEVFMARPKETNFFTGRWSLGPAWYEALFAESSPGQILGEASVAYTDPTLSPVAAKRMAATIPDARLICILRHPVERLRSHFRHEVQRHRESRSLLAALGEPGNPYAARSAYYSCLAPYIERFPRDQIMVARFEDLVRPPAPAWSAALGFLSLPDRPLPEEGHNIGSENPQWTRVMAWASRHGLMPRMARLPGPIRRAGRLALMRGGDTYVRRLEASAVPIPDELLLEMWADVGRLESWLGMRLWSPDSETAMEAAG